MKAERISFLLIASSGAGRCLFSTFRTESCVTRPSPLHFLLLAVKSPSCTVSVCRSANLKYISDHLQLEFTLNGKAVGELTQLVHVSKAREVGRRMAERLKELIPRQMFAITIQAKVGKKVVAREDVKAYRKDVLAKCVSSVLLLSTFWENGPLLIVPISHSLYFVTFCFQYGGDITRKVKLLKQQAEGKKRMRQVGNVSVPRDLFVKVMQRS